VELTIFILHTILTISLFSAKAKSFNTLGTAHTTTVIPAHNNRHSRVGGNPEGLLLVDFQKSMNLVGFGILGLIFGVNLEACFKTLVQEIE